MFDLSKPLAFFAAILVVVLVATYGVTTFVTSKQNDTANATNSLFYKNAIDSCERGNKIRFESNQRAINHRNQDKAIDLIAQGAEAARRAAYKKSGDKFDLQAAEQYAQAHKLVQSLKFDDDPPINCKAIIAKPKKIG